MADASFFEASEIDLTEGKMTRRGPPSLSSQPSSVSSVQSETRIVIKQCSVIQVSPKMNTGEVEKVFVSPKPPAVPRPPLAPPPNPPSIKAPSPPEVTTPQIPTAQPSSQPILSQPSIIQLVQPRAHQNSNAIAIAQDLPKEMDRPEWKVEDYAHLEQIHSGYASSVYRAVCKLSKQKVVLKVYQPDLLHEISQCQLMREARIHVKLRHPNIIRMWAAFKQADGIVIVQEYADGGDLLKIMTDNGMKLYERQALEMVIKPLLNALQYLHSHQIIHRDVKLENILFDGPGMVLKLADFGLCLSLREERAVTRAGTLDYMAPELLKCPTKDHPDDNKDRTDLCYNTSVDIWSAGILAYELINGAPPYTRHDREVTEELILSGVLPAFLVMASNQAKDFVNSCLIDGCVRPSASDLLRHSWITGLSLKHEPEKAPPLEEERNALWNKGKKELKKRQGHSGEGGLFDDADACKDDSRSSSPIHLIPHLDSSHNSTSNSSSLSSKRDGGWKSPVLCAAMRIGAAEMDDNTEERSSTPRSSLLSSISQGYRSAAASPTLIRSQIPGQYHEDDIEML